MGVLFVFPRRHHVASGGSANPKTAGSTAAFPDRFNKSETKKKRFAGIRARAFHMETAERSTPAASAAALVPPKASTTSSTVLSINVHSSRMVKKSTVHNNGIAKICESGTVSTMDSRATIAKRLRATQDALNLSATELCREIGEGTNAWSQYVNAKRPLTLRVADKLCSTYGLTLDWLFRGNRSGLPLDFAQRIRNVS